ncbi:MAG: hypothetical protein QM602_02250 [Microbacterium sp.]
MIDTASIPTTPVPQRTARLRWFESLLSTVPPVLGVPLNLSRPARLEAADAQPTPAARTERLGPEIEWIL